MATVSERKEVINIKENELIDKVTIVGIKYAY
jgi:hypothetical protein